MGVFAWVYACVYVSMSVMLCMCVFLGGVDVIMDAVGGDYLEAGAVQCSAATLAASMLSNGS
jgi:hypothetical protein